MPARVPSTQRGCRGSTNSPSDRCARSQPNALVAFGWWVEPLRGSNPDFDIVGPAWLTVVAFSALALVEGMLVAAVVGRLSRAFRTQVKTPPTKAGKSHKALVVGRVALVAAALVSLPGFVLTVADILSRSP
jgi:hypothetical protein